jgi:enediyne biosynthesis protein E4
MLAALGCVVEKDDDDAADDDDFTASPTEELSIGDEVVCVDPVSGMGRFSEQSQTRGLTRGLSDPGAIKEPLAWGHGGSTVAQDMDADGDIDLVFGRFDGDPDIYVNDGTGNFARREITLEVPPRLFETVTISAQDMDGDDKTDLILTNEGWVLLYRALGDYLYAPFEEIHIEDGSPRHGWLTHTWGDPDGDNDLDLLLPTSTNNGGEGDPELLVWNEDGVFGEPTRLDNGVGTTTLVGLFTDVDGDQDSDIFIPSDLGPPSTMWRNDAGAFTEIAESVGAAVSMAGMGVDAADLNGDGLLDYCITDVGPPRCLQSDPSGIYVEPGAALGLTPAEWIEHAGTIGWSLDFADFDADGNLDLAQSGGPFPKEDSEEEVTFFDWPDLLWSSDDDGQFTDVTAEAGFGDIANHTGLATADFDGDGFLDIVAAGPINTPVLHMNTCGAGGWLMVELVGPLGNNEGFGAQVEIEDGTYRQTREVQSLRGISQGPSRIHFGLGNRDEVDRLTVRWPDGETSNFAAVPTRRQVTVAHPSRVE